MPLYAYCSKCKCNVWVDESGACEIHGLKGLGPLEMVDNTADYTVLLTCHSCGSVISTPSNSTTSTCKNCGTSRTLVRCRKCKSAAFVPDAPGGRVPGKFACPDCTAGMLLESNTITAGQYAASLDTAGVKRPTTTEDEGRRVVNLQLLGVSGARLEPGSICRLSFFESDFEISQGSTRLRYDYSDLLRLEIGGAGLSERYTGPVGLGIGGVLAASLVDGGIESTIDTNLDVGVMNAEFLLHTDQLTPQQLRQAMSAAFMKFNQVEYERKHTVVSGAQCDESGDSVVGQLERIQKLREVNAISEEEYAELKRRILA